MMDELAKEYVIDFFTKRLLHFKDTPEAVGWTPKGQILRYESVLSMLEIHNKSLLDFGCGKGDFYGFLKKRGIKCDYTGIDINPLLIKLARQNHPEAKFLLKDIEQEVLDKSFDIVIAIGVFNLSVQNVKDSAQRCLKILFDHTREKLLFTCLNMNTKLKDISVAYFTSDELQAIAERITEKFRIFDKIIEDELFLIMEKL